MDVSENSGCSPQIIHFSRVFHYFHHPFWGNLIFGNTHIWLYIALLYEMLEQVYWFTCDNVHLFFLSYFFCFRNLWWMIGRVKNCCPCRYLVDPFIHQWRGYDDPANLQDNEHQMVFEDRVIIMYSWMRWPHFQKLHQIETSRNFEIYGMFPLPNVVKMFGKVLETINPTCITMFIPRSQCRFSTILTAFFKDLRNRLEPFEGRYVLVPQEEVINCLVFFVRQGNDEKSMRHVYVDAKASLFVHSNWPICQHEYFFCCWSYHFPPN